MPILLYQYHFPEIPMAPVSNCPPEAIRSLRAALHARELLVLRSHGNCEVFLVPARDMPAKKMPDEARVQKVLQRQGLVPHREGAQQSGAEEKRMFRQSVVTGRDAVFRFMYISVGAAGSRLLEHLHAQYAALTEAELTGPLLNRLFQRGIWLHEKVRQETEFFRFAVEPAAVIDELAKKIVGAGKKHHVAVIGHHPTQFVMIAELLHRGYRNLTFLGSETEVDRSLALGVNATVRTGAELDHLPEEADILIAFPSTTHRLSDEQIIQHVQHHPQGALLIFDFAQSPLDFPRLNRINDLYIYRAADVEKVIRYNEEERQATADEVVRWIEREVDAFYQWHDSEARYQFAGIIGASAQMQRVFEMISRIARTDITVLIDGESGTGKELVAHAIHNLSARSHQPFMVINCGAIPENLLESELFGHVRGAFTGAVAQKEGLFEAANHGTLFLDEIGELPTHLQVKLLRALQEGEIKRVGSNETVRVDVRVLAATNKDLAKMVAEGHFRSDLFYRLNVIQLTIAPLRERREDIALLAQHFVKKFAQKLHKDVMAIAPDVLNILREYEWPGNVRELENAMERAVAMAFGKTIQRYDLPPTIQPRGEKSGWINGKLSESPLTLKELEKQYIIQMLEACEWNYELASKQLGIGRTTLWRKLREYRIVDK